MGSFSAVAVAAILAARLQLASATQSPARLKRQVSTSSFEDTSHHEVDDTPGMGLLYEGVGAISGGGATSKLLFDYPENISSQILDVLFKPGYGPNLDVLKVEIGGDTDSTEGSEPSHIREDGDMDFNRGYEWWLMKEAKKRNPDIKLYGLPWGWPGGLDPKHSPDHEAKEVFKNASFTANYTLQWLLGAKREHGLHIDYVGLWNEMDAPEEYAQKLKEVVRSSELGETTKVFERLVHYPGAGIKPDKEGCQQHKADEGTGTTWADEEGSIFDGRSARCLARVLNRNYISKCRTATIQWHLISSFYDYLPWPRCGLAIANEPWSGNFEITSPTWAVAHTTQFAPAGWRYLMHGHGVGMMKNGGSMVTRASPDKKDFSIVLEKIDSSTSACGHGVNPEAPVAEEEVVIELKGSLLKAFQERGVLNVWRSNLSSSSEYGANPPESELLQRVGGLRPKDGIIRLRMYPEEVVTLTTLSTGGKILVESPPKAPFPIPYLQSYDNEKVGSPPRLWYDQMGAWEITTSPYGDAETRGQVMRQVVPVWPNCWGYMCSGPVTHIGPASLKGDLTVTFDVRMEDKVVLVLSPVGMNYTAVALDSAGRWSMGNKAHGAFRFPLNKWHSVKMRMRPDGAQDVKVNGQILVDATKMPHPSFLAYSAHQGEICSEDNFPDSTVGKFHSNLKPGWADTIDSCRTACCKDENLCNIWQFNTRSKECQIGRKEEGYERDLQGIWVGGTRGEMNGWHFRVSLSRYAHVSIDNFRIEESSD